MSQPSVLESRGELFEMAQHARRHKNDILMRRLAQQFYALGDYEFADMLRGEAALIEITK